MIYPETYIIRNNPGMIRDCWIEHKEKEVVFVLRQIKIENGEVDAKVIRLVDIEIWRLLEFLDQHCKKELKQGA